MTSFTPRKFARLPLPLQHKYAAMCLKQIYEGLLIGKEIEEYKQQYKKMLQGIGQICSIDWDLHSIANGYHAHMEKAGIALRESDFLPHVRRGDKSETPAEPLPVAIYLDHLRSAHNVGSILRTVEAFRLGCVYFSAMTPHAAHAQVQRTAMGCVDWIQWQQCNDLKELPQPIIALETSTQAISLYDFVFPQNFTLAVGNEENGCSHELLTQADYLLEIPLYGRKNSLNVANAFAIVANEISRQRRLSTCPQKNRVFTIDE